MRAFVLELSLRVVVSPLRRLTDSHRVPDPGAHIVLTVGADPEVRGRNQLLLPVEVAAPEGGKALFVAHGDMMRAGDDIGFAEVPSWGPSCVPRGSWTRVEGDAQVERGRWPTT